MRKSGGDEQTRRGGKKYIERRIGEKEGHRGGGEELTMRRADNERRSGGDEQTRRRGE